MIELANGIKKAGVEEIYFELLNYLKEKCE